MAKTLAGRGKIVHETSSTRTVAGRGEIVTESAAAAAVAGPPIGTLQMMGVGR